MRRRAEDSYSQINGQGSFHKGKSPYITPFVSPQNILFALQAYVRDLEEPLKQRDESNLTSSEWIGSLKEISQYEEAEANSVQHIADLEARLLRADESVLDIQQAVERLEREAAHRCEEVESSSLDSHPSRRTARVGGTIQKKGRDV